MHVNCKQKTRFGAIFGTLPTPLTKKTTSQQTINRIYIEHLDNITNCIFALILYSTENADCELN